MGCSKKEYWSGLPFPPSGCLTNPGIEPASPELSGRFFTTEPPGKPHILACCCCPVLQSYPTLCNSMDYSPWLLCPWDFPGKNTGVGCHFLLQDVFPTQRSNQHLLNWQGDSLALSHLGSPTYFPLLLFSPSVVSNSLWPHELQHTKLLYPSLSLGVCSNSRPLSWWCHPTILFFVIPFSSCLQFFPASCSFPMSGSSYQVAKVLDL